LLLVATLQLLTRHRMPCGLPGMARVTTSSHSHNHALSGPDTQATAVQQELSAALTESIQEWARCGLATTAIRQLVQLELSVPFLTNDTKKKVWYCHTDLQVASVSPCACGRVSHRSRIWCRKRPVQKSTPSMPTSSFRLLPNSQALFSTTGWTLKAVSKPWSGLSLNRLKPCSCMVMCGYKTTHARHWWQTVPSLQSWASMATAGGI
jgi:hypothetical protein